MQRPKQQRVWFVGMTMVAALGVAAAPIGEARATSNDGLADVVVTAPGTPVAPGAPLSASVLASSLGAAVPGPISVRVFAGVPITSASGSGWTCGPEIPGSPGYLCTHPGPIPAGSSLPAIAVGATATTTGVDPSGNRVVSYCGYTGAWCQSPSASLDHPGTSGVAAQGFAVVPLDTPSFDIVLSAAPNPVPVGQPVTLEVTPQSWSTTPVPSPIGVRFEHGFLPVTGFSASGSGWTCNEGPVGFTTCESAVSIPVGGSAPPVSATFTPTSIGDLVPPVAGIANGILGAGIGVFIDVTGASGTLDLDDGGASFSVGGTSSYTVAITNGTGSTLVAPLVVRLFAGSGLTWSGGYADPSGDWSCQDLGNGEIECSYGFDLDDGLSAPTLTIDYDVSESFTACQSGPGDCVTLDGRLEVQGSEISADVEETPIGTSSLAATISATPTVVAAGPGTSVTFSVQVTNDGVADESGVLVAVVPSGGAATDPTPTPASIAAGWSCTPGPIFGAGTQAECRNFGVVPGFGGTAPLLELTYAVGPGPFYSCDFGSVGPECFRGFIDRLEGLGSGANFSFPSAPPAEVSVTGAPAVTVAIDDGGGSAPQGGVASYDVTLTHAGGPAHPGPLRVVLDACQPFESCDQPFVASFLGATGGGWTCAPFFSPAFPTTNLLCETASGVAVGASLVTTFQFGISATRPPTQPCPGGGLCAVVRAGYGFGDASSLAPGRYDEELSPVAAQASVAAPGGAGTLALAGSLGQAITDVFAVAPGTGGTPPAPGGVSFPYGAVGFTLRGVTPGSIATVSLTLPGPVASYYKLAAGAWTPFPFDGATGAQIAGSVVTLALRDGGRGDADGVANGVIVDPGAPATGALPDADADGVPDAQDNCPFAANADQADSGGVGNGSPPDGVGDACQCGDVSGDGRVTLSDAVVITRSLLVPPTATRTRPELCDVGGTPSPSTQDCTIGDAVLIRRALLSPPTATLSQACAPARP